MDLWLVLNIAAALYFLGMGVYALGRAPAMRRELRRVASVLGLQGLVLPGPLSRDTTGLVGTLDGFRVTIKPLGESGAHLETTITIDTFGGKHGRIPHDLELRRESGNWVDKLARGHDLLTGDEDFDRQILVRGDPGFVHALLNAETRLAVLKEILANRTRIESGSVVRNLTGMPKTNGVLEDAVRDVVRLAKHLVVELRDVPALLAAQALGDPLAEVRRTALDTLLARFGDYPRAGETARAALEDRSRAVRLRAAVFLGEDGQGTLMEIAERPDVDEPLAAQAFAHLTSALPRHRILELIDTVLPRARAAAKLVAIEALVRLGGEAAVTRLEPLLGDASADAAAAAARGLGQLGDATAEPALIRALASDRNDVGAATAEALGRLGSRTAIAPLRAATARSASSSQVRAAARTAMAKIQARIVGGAPGQVSLAQDEDAQGRVSLAPPEPHGQVSLAGSPTGDGRHDTE
jgi:HEAT repeat protein